MADSELQSDASVLWWLEQSPERSLEASFEARSVQLGPQATGALVQQQDVRPQINGQLMIARLKTPPPILSPQFAVGDQVWCVGRANLNLLSQTDTNDAL